MKFHGALMLAACLLMASSAHAQRNQLRVGHDAPAFDDGDWVKGAPTTIRDDNVYVIEFWATWCGPCRAAIPKLTALQNRFEPDGLRIIGVSTEEKQVVERFVEAQGDRISYSIVVDTNKNIERNWMQAAGQRGIPSAFIVDGRGKIQFIGHPGSDEFAQVLELVIGGRYDAQLFRDAQPAIQAAENARRMRNWRQALNHYDQVISVDPYIFAPIELTKFDIMMVDMEEPAAAYDYARLLLGRYADDWAFLVQLAEKIATDPAIPNDKRDVSVAMQVIRAAVSAAPDRNDPRLLAAQALVHYHNGEKNRAVSLQRRAWMIADPSRKSGYERVLRSYQESASEGSDSTRSSGRGASFR